MKKFFALLLCLLLVFQLAACNFQTQQSILELFGQWLEEGGYETSTTTDATGVSTTVLTPPGTTLPTSSVTQPTSQTTTRPTTQPTTAVPSTAVTTTQTTQTTTASKAPTSTVTVQIPTTEPEVLRLTATNLTLMNIGNTHNLSDGTIAPNRIAWVSTNPKVATVSGGIVTGVGVGTCQIIANFKDQTAICRVTVQIPTTTATTTQTTQTTTQTTTTVPSGSHSAVPYTQRYLYSLLTNQEKSWYRSIDKAVSELKDTVSLGVDMSVNERYYIYFIYAFDNPEHFYLGARVSYSTGGMLYFSYADGTTNSYYGNDVASITDTMRANIRTRKMAFQAEVDRIISSVPTNIPPVEKEKLLYDRLLVDLSYNSDALTNNLWDGVANPNWTAYGGIINKTGVCEAYSEAFQVLCYAVGINCTGVVGNVDGGGHKWNAVQLDGEWYACDATFDDPVGGRPGVAAYHKYFNLTGEEMAADGHSTDGSRYPGPNCTGTKYSYSNYFR